MDVTQLTDIELREALVTNGVNIGPITPSTRGVYEKKLAKLTSNQNNSQNTSQILEQLNTSKNDASPVSEPVISKNVATPLQYPVFEKPTATPSPDSAKGDSDASDVEDYEGEESMRYLTEEEIAESNASLRQAAPSKNKLRNFIILSIAFAAIGVFAFFLLENAEVFLAPSKTGKNDEI